MTMLPGPISYRSPRFLNRFPFQQVKQFIEKMFPQQYFSRSLRMSSRRAALLSLVVLTLGGLVSGPVVAEIKKPVVALLPGVVDPFYFTMYRGAQQAAKEEGVELVFQIPKAWNTAEQVPILKALIAKRPDVLLVSPVDKQQLVR